MNSNPHVLAGIRQHCIRRKQVHQIISLVCFRCLAVSLSLSLSRARTSAVCLSNTELFPNPTHPQVRARLRKGEPVVVACLHTRKGLVCTILVSKCPIKCSRRGSQRYKKCLQKLFEECGFHRRPVARCSTSEFCAPTSKLGCQNPVHPPCARRSLQCVLALM